ncbi:hypothetical protein ACJX0J_035617, partial [Zea mays]
IYYFNKSKKKKEKKGYSTMLWYGSSLPSEEYNCLKAICISDHVTGDLSKCLVKQEWFAQI